MNSKDKLVPFGVLVKPHGLKGYINCRLFNSDSKLLKENFNIFFENNLNISLKIESVNYSARNTILKFFEINGRNEVESYRNKTFYIRKLDLPSLNGNENYFVDYINSELYDSKDRYLGIVSDIIPVKENDILVYKHEKVEKLLPFAKELILFFDKDTKKLKMDLIDSEVLKWKYIL